MKRLLSYLIIVITLGLTIKDNAETSVNYVFCKNIAYGSVNIQLNKCSRTYISVDADKYVFTKLLGDTEDEDYKNKQDQFNGEMERLLDEFKVYNLDVNLILETIKKNKQLNKYFSNLSASAKNRLINQKQKSKKIVTAKKEVKKIINVIGEGTYKQDHKGSPGLSKKRKGAERLCSEKARSLALKSAFKKIIVFTDYIEQVQWSSYFNDTIVGENIINQSYETADEKQGGYTKYAVSCVYKSEFRVNTKKLKLYAELKNNGSNQESAKLDEERRKIEEEKRKIEEEKRKIAEAKKKQEEEEKKRKEANTKLYVIGSGTGFFVSNEGHVVSNDHVVGICRKVATKIEGETKYFNILKTDEVNDLGIIKGDYKSPNFLSIKPDGAEYGEDIVAFGYPLADALSTSVKLTRGIVSSLSGPGNNYSEIQIDAAIQPGNSGGPVLNMEGQVVGVASSGLNKLYMLEKAEYIPENVNFAVASPTLSNFLKANGVPISNQSYDVKNTKELAKIGRPSTLQLFCMNTKAVFEELKKKKKHSDVLFEKVIELR